jgi:aminopeptidase N
VRSLLKDEAETRARLLRVQSYAIALDLTGAADFRSVTTVRFAASEPGARTFIDLVPARLVSARLNGVDLDVDSAFSLADSRLTLAGLAADNELVVDAIMPYSHDGEGLHRHRDPADDRVYLYANSSVTAGPRWFACFDQPDMKATVAFDVRCPSDWILAGNGPARQLEAGHWQLAPTEPFSTYLVALIAGPYHSVTGNHDGIPLALHARASLAEHLDRDAASLLEFTGGCLDEFHRLFGIRYPWGEYHQAFVPEFNWGAMENPGCVTFREHLLFRTRVTDSDRRQRESVIAHEMAHMWFGNLVTMQWWDDLWLNESFAEYLGHQVCSTVTGDNLWIEFGAHRKSWGHAADRRPSTHPVAGNGVMDAESALGVVDGISYAKGAAVLRQLAEHLGDDVFYGGLRDYFAIHAYGNARFSDLIDAWVRAAGTTDVTVWAEQWLRTSGVDTLRIVETGDQPRVLRSGTGRPHQIAVASFDDRGVELSRVEVSVTEDITAIPPLPASRAVVVPDADDATWAKIVLNAAEWQTMPNLLPALPTETRVVVWNALRLAVADTEVSPDLALQIAAAALAQETDDAVLATGALWMTDVVLANYVKSDEARDAGERALRQALETNLASAAPGSGQQLAAVRAWLDVSEAAPLLAWLNDDLAPADLELDTELRWQLVQRLSALGHIDDAQIETEAERDRSTTGAVHAASCRALRPQAEAKAAAWQTLAHDAECTNYELYALARGFWHPRHRALTDAYVARYFEQIPATASFRAGMVLKVLLRAAFPHTATDPAALAAADTIIGSAEVDEGIRHVVGDQADDLRRAMAIRAAHG